MIEQNTDEWLKMKLGVVSASNVSRAMAKKGTDTRASYVSELVAQIATRESTQIDGVALRWGKENEPKARRSYELLTGNEVKESEFIYGKDKRVGCSPDGIIEKLKRGLELKCPYTSKVHVDFLAMDKIKKEYLDQVQFSMWVTGLEQWDFGSYDPRFKDKWIKILSIDRDDGYMKKYDNEIPLFLADMDIIMDKLELTFGQQWT